MKAKVSSGTAGISTGIPEYKLTLAVSLYLKDELLARGYEVIMTRETHDIDISNMQRAEMMNELGVDLALRIHCDGAEDKTANGIGLFVHEVPFIRPNTTDIYQSGVVTTIEPGLYIPGWGGVRIEDQVLITENGNENMISIPHDMIEL